MSLENAPLATVLRGADWMQMLPDASQERVITDCSEHFYQAKQYVAHRGDVAHTWIGVASGLVRAGTSTAGGRSVLLAAATDGSWMGEGSVIKREPRRYDLVAMRPTRVIHVPRATFMWLLENHIPFNRYVIDHLNERVGQFMGMLETSRIIDPPGRVAGAIIQLFNPTLYPRTGQLLNISQEEIGELAGLSRSTTNSALMKLKKMLLVEPRYGGLVILDMERLKEYVFSVAEDSAISSGG